MVRLTDKQADKKVLGRIHRQTNQRQKRKDRTENTQTDIQTGVLVDKDQTDKRLKQERRKDSTNCVRITRRKEKYLSTKNFDKLVSET